MRTLLKIRRALATGGVRRLLRLGLNRLRHKPSLFKEQVSDFDLRYGIDTSGLIDQVDLDTHAFPNWIHGVRYQPSREGLLQKLVVASGIEPGKYSFVDLGCGKGRMVFAASEVGFMKSTGVEFSEALLGEASRNAEAFRQQRGGVANIEFHHGDASIFELPRGPLVIYLYNPFDASVMGEVAKHAAARPTGGEDLWIWYHDPVCADCWDRANFKRVIELPDLQTVMWSR